MSKPIPIDTAKILAAVVVPWTERYEFDEGRFCREVRIITAGLTPYVYTFGTAGEGYAVNEAQFDRIAEAFWRSARECGGFPILGIISLSLSTVIGRIERGHALGFRDFQLSLPAWGELNDEELDAFFTETCGRFPDCHFHHYNLARTKRVLTSAEYLRLAAAHPNLVSVKAGGRNPAVIADLLKATSRLRFFFTEFGYEMARRSTDDVGLLISLASADYARARAYVEGDQARRTADVQDMQVMIEALQAIAKERKLHIDGAFDKMLFRLNDPSFPLRLLSPYQGATEEEFVRFKHALPPGWSG